MTQHIDDHDRGLAFDLATLSRRRALLLLGGASVATIAAAGTASATTGTVDCAEIPQETAGPYPGDGSNGPNVLDDRGIVRSDIRSSFGNSSGTANGVPLTIALTIERADGQCGPFTGAAVYVWQCDAAGRYSLYTPGVEDENYLRGVQVADNQGKVSYTSIFPGCYQGRWPHVHFEVYRTLKEATTVGEPIKTSQLAFPRKDCEAVYTSGGYRGSQQNLSGVSLRTDMVFKDGWETQMATLTGGPSQGYTATLTVPV